MKEPEFEKLFPNVSRESLNKLQIYHDLLVKWQKAINLVGSKTLPEAWVRHFADSVQLADYIPEGAVVADIGSGAGFPGLVLAIVRPDLQVHLIESDERKCQFLKAVSRETDVLVRVHTQRIEAGIEGVLPNFVTARALADVRALLGYVEPWAEGNPDLLCLFLKGANVDQELGEAAAFFDFSHSKEPSKTARDACILRIQSIEQKSRV
ncbi:MAG: 16S rRNA (guanine(527)-N(7))-methyltransferase RsmG [Alphaproteobacteria bacterium]|nr:16S rRNA (guanine(527)-N(7))-methyltransferase RsmG [Alphaproteobacteria bacterium]